MNVAKLLYQDHFKPTGFSEEQMRLGAFPNYDPKPFVLEQINAIETTPRYMQYLPNSQLPKSPKKQQMETIKWGSQLISRLSTAPVLTIHVKSPTRCKQEKNCAHTKEVDTAQLQTEAFKYLILKPSDNHDAMMPEARAKKKIYKISMRPKQAIPFELE